MLHVTLNDLFAHRPQLFLLLPGVGDGDLKAEQMVRTNRCVHETEGALLGTI